VSWSELRKRRKPDISALIQANVPPVVGRSGNADSSAAEDDETFRCPHNNEHLRHSLG
jgi:hypothetical protein